jgi:hypothetical protein
MRQYQDLGTCPSQAHQLRPAEPSKRAVHSLLRQDPSLGKYITASLEDVHNLAFAVIAHDLLGLLPRDFECAVCLICLGSRVECIIHRAVEGCLSTLLRFLPE